MPRSAPGAVSRGDWLHGRLTAENPGFGSYDDDELGATPCSYHDADGPGRHAMRSREYEAAAFTEGFAHFIAALAWNDHTTTDGRFRYYKNITTPAWWLGCAAQFGVAQP